jgi:MFS family permease
MTNSETLLALFTAVRLAPMFLGPLSGVLADRFDRARFMLVTVVWATLAIVATATLVSAGCIGYWGIVAGGFAIGLAQSPAQPARYALVLDIVGRDNISSANALNSMAINMTQVIGPAIGGGLISAFGAPTALWVSAVCYPASFLALWPLRNAGAADRSGRHETVVRQLLDGLRIVRTSRLIAAVLTVTLAANIFLWPVYQAFMPVFAKNILHLGPSGLGLLLMCSGIGGLFGSVVIALMGDFPYKGGIFVFGTAAWAVFWSLFAMSHSASLSFVLIALVGLASAPFGVLQGTLLLILTPAHLRGRVMGLQELAIGILPVATFLHGLVARHIGVAASTVASGFLLAATMIVLAVSVPRLLSYGGQAPAPTPDEAVDFAPVAADVP